MTYALIQEMIKRVKHVHQVGFLVFLSFGVKSVYEWFG